jgi:hypothetical protein
MLLMVCSALLAAGTAFVLDEPAHAVADVTASRERQVRVRARVLAIPAAVAGLLIAISPHGHPAPASLLLAFSGALLLAFTIARCLRETSGLPGAAAATISIAVGIFPGMLGSFSPIQTFPGADAARTALGSNSWWTISDLACGACAVLLSRRVHANFAVAASARRRRPR